jgi:diacylglycerol kinase family enzyme
MSSSPTAADSPSSAALAPSSPPSSTASTPSDPATQDIVLIVPSPSPSPSSPTSYAVYSLVETPPLPPPTDADADAQNNDSSTPPTAAQPPFVLKIHTTDSIPDDVLERFLVRAPPTHLAHGNVDVIVSTGSGAGLALPFWRDVLEPLLHVVAGTGAATEAKKESTARGTVDGQSGREQKHRVLVTQDAQSVRQFAHDKWTPWIQQTHQDQPQAKQHTIVVLSGDGGIVDLLNGLTGIPPGCATRPTLAILPLGTANALFHSLHKPLYAASPSPTPLVLALRTLFLPTTVPAPLPVFRARFSAGAHMMHGDQRGREVSALSGAIVASYGLHASIVWESDTPEYRSFGVKRFAMVAAELLRQSHAYSARVKITTSDGKKIRAQSATDTHGYVLASLVSNLEREFTISPASKPLDGKLRLVRFGAVGGDKTMEIMRAAYRDGAHVDMSWQGPDGAQDGVGYDEAEEIVMTMHEEDPRWRKVCVDGTIVEVPPGGRMTISRQVESPFNVLVHGEVLGQ